MAITLDGSTNKLEIGANATGPSSLRLYEDTDNGTHYIDIIAPATVTSNRTLTLPDATGTILTSATTTGFPAGSVLQVVQSTLATFSTTTSTTYTDTGLSASITPSSSSSKILIISSAGVGSSASAGGSLNRIVRGSTAIFTQGVSYSGTGSVYTGSSLVYLDSPATTSSTTYKIQFVTQNASSTAFFNGDFGSFTGETASITLMEIAA
jgi:hypothetical protein